ncbi:hypothetical protein D9M68_783450 [compost metagenome]
MLAGMQVDHELRQGPMQTGNGPTQQREARTGQPGGGFEIQPAVFFTQADVILNREIEAFRCAPAAHLDIGLFIVPHRYRLMRQVGNVQQQVVQLDLDGIQFALALIQLAAHAIDIRQQRRNVFAALLGLADSLGAAVALGLQLLGPRLHGLALGFQRFETRYIQLKATASETLSHFVELAAYQFGVEHVQVSIHVQRIAWL